MGEEKETNIVYANRIRREVRLGVRNREADNNVACEADK